MRAYQVWYDNGESWSDANRWTGGIYTSHAEANKEILDEGFIWNEKTGSYVLDKVKIAQSLNEEHNTKRFTVQDVYGENFATIEEVKVLERYVKRGGVV